MLKSAMDIEVGCLFLARHGFKQALLNAAVTLQNKGQGSWDSIDLNDSLDVGLLIFH